MAQYPYGTYPYNSLQIQAQVFQNQNYATYPPQFPVQPNCFGIGTSINLNAIGFKGIPTLKAGDTWQYGYLTFYANTDTTGSYAVQIQQLTYYKIGTGTVTVNGASKSANYNFTAGTLTNTNQYTYFPQTTQQNNLGNKIGLFIDLTNNQFGNGAFISALNQYQSNGSPTNGSGIGVALGGLWNDISLVIGPVGSPAHIGIYSPVLTLFSAVQYQYLPAVMGGGKDTLLDLLGVTL